MHSSSEIHASLLALLTSMHSLPAWHKHYNRHAHRWQRLLMMVTRASQSNIPHHDDSTAAKSPFMCQAGSGQTVHEAAACQLSCSA